MANDDEYVLVYMVRRISDGLYSCGGRHPDFKEVGRVWTNKGHVKNHLKASEIYKRAKKYEVVSFSLLEEDAASLSDFVSPPTPPTVHLVPKRRKRPLCGAEEWEKSSRKAEEVNCPNCRRTKTFTEMIS